MHTSLSPQPLVNDGTGANTYNTHSHNMYTLYGGSTGQRLALGTMTQPGTARGQCAADGHAATNGQQASLKLQLAEDINTCQALDS
jgi:hypothetical protein